MMVLFAVWDFKTGSVKTSIIKISRWENKIFKISIKMLWWSTTEVYTDVYSRTGGY